MHARTKYARVRVNFHVESRACVKFTNYRRADLNEFLFFFSPPILSNREIKWILNIKLSIHCSIKSKGLLIN